MKFLELGWPRVEFSRASRIANTRQLEVPSQKSNCIECIAVSGGGCHACQRTVNNYRKCHRLMVITNSHTYSGRSVLISSDSEPIYFADYIIIQ